MGIFALAVPGAHVLPRPSVHTCRLAVSGPATAGGLGLAVVTANEPVAGAGDTTTRAAIACANDQERIWTEPVLAVSWPAVRPTHAVLAVSPSAVTMLTGACSCGACAPSRYTRSQEADVPGRYCTNTWCTLPSARVSPAELLASAPATASDKPLLPLVLTTPRNGADGHAPRGAWLASPKTTASTLVMSPTPRFMSAPPITAGPWFWMARVKPWAVVPAGITKVNFATHARSMRTGVGFQAAALESPGGLAAANCSALPTMEATPQQV